MPRGVPRMERRLAAVLAADVASYSRLMGIDEVGTLNVLLRMVRTRLQPGEAPLAQPLDHGALRYRDGKAALDLAAQVNAAPADDLMDLGIRAVEHPLAHFAHLRLGQLARCAR